MPLVDKVTYVREPTDLQCGQAVLAMLSGDSVENVAALLNNQRETTRNDMFYALDFYSIGYSRDRKQAESLLDLPPVCILSLETPRCWHWSLWYKGRVYDPEHGVLTDFPESNRKYYFEIFEQ